MLKSIFNNSSNEDYDLLACNAMYYLDVSGEPAGSNSKPNTKLERSRLWLLRARFLIGLVFDIEDQRDTFLRNISKIPPSCTALQSVVMNSNSQVQALVLV
jgi:hypothetical protein